MDEPTENAPLPWLTVDLEGSLYQPKVDIEKMGRALILLAKDIAIHKATGVASNAEEAFKTLGLKLEPAALAGLLLQRAMTDAFQQIIEENRYRYGDALPDEKQTMQYFAVKYGSRTATPLNADFFQKPHRLPFLAEVAKPFRQWLVACQVPEAEAQRLAEVHFPRPYPRTAVG